jgi:ParB family transcriptional regulator, chromosome partitioning protein
MTTETRRTQGGLGRGLASLIPSAPDGSAREIEIDRIRVNPWQPRGHFEDDQLQTLAASISQHGVLQPVLLTQVDDGYQLIAGERRLRASVLAGKRTIPAVVRTADEQSQLSLALVENLQRADLNALDEARAFRQLMDEFGLTQEQVAQRVGRSRASIANTIRLLSVAQAVQDAVRVGSISEGHARALAGLDGHDQQQRALEVVQRKGLSVRQTERLVKDELAARVAAAPATISVDEDADLEQMASRLRDALGTRVTLAPGKRGGRIIITWFEADDLMRLIERLAGGDR